MPLFRRPTLPDAVRTRLGLERRERVLAFVGLHEGWAVATTHRLHVVADDAEPFARPWAEVGTARLDPDAGILTVTWVDGVEPTELALTDGSSMEFPRVVRQCIDSSLVHSERVALRGGAVVRVALRRDADDALFTQVLGTGDVDLSDPATAAAIDAAEARVRDAAGLA